MEILTEKYRPKTLDDLVVINDEFKQKMEQWINDKTIDGHLLFVGPAGVGKSSSISVIINELGITDYVIINGSDKTGIDDTRKIIDYAAIPPINGKIKLIVFEEFERLSQNSQDSLKYAIEQYSEWTRFIFTTNNITKVSEPIISRCQTYYFNTLDLQMFSARVVKIIMQECKKFEQNDVIKYINTYYPDLRKCINVISQNIINKELLPLNDSNELTDNFYSLLIHLKESSVSELQKSILGVMNDNDILELYRYITNNLKLLSDDKFVQGQIVIKVAEYMYKHQTVAFTDINLVACLLGLKMLIP